MAASKGLMPRDAFERNILENKRLRTMEVKLGLINLNRRAEEVLIRARERIRQITHG